MASGGDYSKELTMLFQTKYKKITEMPAWTINLPDDARFSHNEILRIFCSGRNACITHEIRYGRIPNSDLTCRTAFSKRKAWSVGLVRKFVADTAPLQKTKVIKIKKSRACFDSQAIAAAVENFTSPSNSVSY